MMHGTMNLKLPWGIKFELLIFFPLVQKNFIWNLQSSNICRDNKKIGTWCVWGWDL